MNTYEVTDPDAPAFGYGPNRPEETVEDWIAAGADCGELEVRPMFQVIDDDELQHAHDMGLCPLCNDTITVADREQWMAIEMAHFEVKWDPTIRL